MHALALVLRPERKRTEGREGGRMSTDEQHMADDVDPRGSVLSEIANTMVRLYKDCFGRGPTQARAQWCGGDVLTVVLEDTLTPAERSLVKMGEHQRLRDTR